MVQLATAVEIRAGAIGWLRSISVLFLIGSGPTATHSSSTHYSGAVFMVIIILLLVVCAVCWGREAALAAEDRDFIQLSCLLAMMLVAVPLVKDPSVYIFLAKDLAVDRKIATSILAVLDSPGWVATSLAGKKDLLQPLMPTLLAASRAGNVGFWSAYVELLFCATSEAELNAVVTLLRYHIAANLSALTDFKLNIERKTEFCFRVAAKPPVSRDNYERCVQGSMDIMYEKSLNTAGRPNLVFTGGVPDVLRDSWHRAFEECLNSKPEVRARKCKMAAALRSEFLFFLEAPEAGAKK